MPTSITAAAKVVPWRFRLLLDFALQNLEKPLSVACLAKTCRLSRCHFARNFKHVTGVTPHRWLLERRVERAKSILVSGGSSLTEVALSCGFYDHAHFSRVFKAMTLVTPSEWRRTADSALSDEGATLPGGRSRNPNARAADEGGARRPAL